MVLHTHWCSEPPPRGGAELELARLAPRLRLCATDSHSSRRPRFLVLMLKGLSGLSLRQYVPLLHPPTVLHQIRTVSLAGPACFPNKTKNQPHRQNKVMERKKKEIRVINVLVKN